MCLHLGIQTAITVFHAKNRESDFDDSGLRAAANFACKPGRVAHSPPGHLPWTVKLKRAGRAIVRKVSQMESEALAPNGNQTQKALIEQINLK